MILSKGTGTLLVVAICGVATIAAAQCPEWAVTTHPADDTTPKWSHDGTRILYDHWVGGGGYDIWVSPALGGTPEPLVEDLAFDDTAADWSPGDSLIAFMSNRAGSYDLWVKRLRDGEMWQVTNHPGDEWLPAWSPVGDQLVFCSDRMGSWDIWMVSVQGGEWVQVTDDPGYEGWPDWSPGADEIVFQTDWTGNLDLWRRPAAGGELTQITTHAAADATPAWSPLGDHIAFTSLRPLPDGYGPVSRDVWVIPATGGDAEPMTFHRGKDAQPTWSPDGQFIAYHTDRASGGEDPPDIWALCFPMVSASTVPATLGQVLVDQNTPNPFNPTTRIRVQVPDAVADARLVIFDARGRRVRAVALGDRSTSDFSITWNGRDDSGKDLPSGIYYYQLHHSGGTTEARRAALLR